MPQPGSKPASSFLIILAFATVYIVWGSTYYFIQRALTGFPPLLIGALRYFGASILLMLWCIFRGKQLFIKEDMKHAAIVGVLLLFIGNGGVIWAEQTIPSAMTAIMVSSAPLWFVILDKKKWKENFRNRSVIIGLVIGFIGVLLLFSEPLMHAVSEVGGFTEKSGLVLLTIAVIAWSGGSLHAKYHPPRGAGIVSATWQMFFAAVAFVPGILFRRELDTVQWNSVSNEAWFSIGYLIVMGSIVAYTAYVWLLQVRPATQVSTHAYANPIVAVLIGVMMANEKISLLQIIGLAIILGSVVLINRSNYSKQKQV